MKVYSLFFLNSSSCYFPYVLLQHLIWGSIKAYLIKFHFSFIYNILSIYVKTKWVDWSLSFQKCSGKIFLPLKNINWSIPDSFASLARFGCFLFPSSLKNKTKHAAILKNLQINSNVFTDFSFGVTFLIICCKGWPGL